MTLIPPGSTIGILGGGQLGRMLCIAAAQLGYRCHIYEPDPEAPASHVAHVTTTASYHDSEALREFGASVDVVTLEFENVPVAALECLQPIVAVAPNPKALTIAQDRLAEKEFVTALGGAPAHHQRVDTFSDLAAAVTSVGTRGILKTRRLGYDGKGQVRLDPESDLAAAWAMIGEAPAIYEAMVDFEHEISVLVARNHKGDMSCYDLVHNVHGDGILQRSVVPVRLDSYIRTAALTLAEKLAHALNFVGVLAVELFVTAEGIIFNEFAPRVHNSGHWTIEGAVTSQFENHIRAICGLPLGSTATRGTVEMHNIIGDDYSAWPRLLADPAAHVHLYGKSDVRSGRKMGHVTWVRPV